MNFEQLRELAFQYPQFIAGFGVMFAMRKVLFRHSTSRDLVTFFVWTGGLIISTFSYYAAAPWFVFLLGFNMKGMRGSSRRLLRGLSFLAISSLGLLAAIIYLEVNEGSSVVLLGIQGVAAGLARFFLFWNNKRILASERFFTGELRAKILARDGHRCVVRGCRETQNLQIDHIKPWSKGGKTTIENAQTLCQHHNASKGAKSQLAWKLSRGL